MNLIELLMNELDINRKQAMGGAGLIFKLAKDRFDDSDYALLSRHIDSLEDIISHAPKPGGLFGSLGSIAAGFGGENSRVAIIARLAGGFSKLHIDSKRIMEFISVIEFYLRDKNDEEVDVILSRISKELA